MSSVPTTITSGELLELAVETNPFTHELGAHLTGPNGGFFGGVLSLNGEVLDGGDMVVESAGMVTNTLVENGGALEVDGGVANDTTVKNGAVDVISGSADGVKVFGGGVEVGDGVTVENISLNGVSDAAFDGATTSASTVSMTGEDNFILLSKPSSFKGTLSGFEKTDLIELEGVADVSDVTWSNNVLTVDTDIGVLHINLIGSYQNTFFVAIPSQLAWSIEIGTPGLFTSGPDVVNFNSLNPSQSAAIKNGAEIYDGEGGSDKVTLPNIASYSASSWNPSNTFITGSRAGDDYGVTGGDGNYNIGLGAGSDTVDVTGNGASSVTLGSGADTVSLSGSGKDTVTADDGETLDSDIITLGSGADKVDLSNATFGPASLVTIVAKPTSATVEPTQLVLPGDASDYEFTIAQSDWADKWAQTTTTITGKTDGGTIKITVEGVGSVAFVPEGSGASPFDNDVNLTDGSVAVEMLRLADQVYGPLKTGHAGEALANPTEASPSGGGQPYPNPDISETAIDPAGENWRAVSALQLGMMAPADFGNKDTLHYSFVDGDYSAYNTSVALSGDPAEGNALVLEGVVNGQQTLAVVFRGTDQTSDYLTYSSFSTYYNLFQPLVSELVTYLNANPDITQVLVSGHSLGSGAVQYFLSSQGLGGWAAQSGHTAEGFTDGTTGAEVTTTGALMANFVNADDPVPVIAGLAGPVASTLFAGLSLSALALDVGLALAKGAGSLTGAAQLAGALLTLQSKKTEGPFVVLDNGVGVTWSNVFAGHNSELYVDELGKLAAFASDKSSPFSSTALAASLLSNSGAYAGPNLRIAIGTPGPSVAFWQDPYGPANDRSDYSDGRYTNQFLSAISANSLDNYVLGNENSPSVITIDENDLFAEVALPGQAGVQRIIHGGSGVSKLVLPVTHSEVSTTGSIASGLRLSTNGVGGVPVGLIGTLYRIGTIWYDDGPVSLNGPAPTVQTPTAGASTFDVSAKFGYANAGNGKMTVVGDGGNDVIYVGTGNKTIIAGGGADTIFVNDSIADQVLVYGGTGADVIVGGPGFDSYVLQNPATQLLLQPGGMPKEIETTFNYTLPSYHALNIIGLPSLFLVLAGSATTGAASAANQYVQANNNGDTLYAVGGDELVGGTGNDSLVSSGGGNTLTGGAGIDTADYSVASTGASWSYGASGAWSVKVGTESADSVKGVELLHFTDRTVSLAADEPDLADFNGNSKSDVVIENTSGAVAVGEVGTGKVLTYTDVATLATTWSFKGDGDFLGDGLGNDQFLIENSSGALDVGRPAGGKTTFTQVTVLSSASKVVGVGDFLVHGDDQFLIESTTGAVEIGEVVKGKAVYTPVATLGSQWKVVGSGDYLDEGHDQFLIESTTGAIQVGDWTAGAAHYTQVATLASTWAFKGSGDFLGDGKTDFLIENAAGTVEVGEVASGVAKLTQIAALTSGWKIVGVGDYLGEGHDQFLMENTAGVIQVGDWTAGTVHYTQVATLGLEWTFH